MLKYYLVFLMICVGITIKAQDKTIYFSLEEALKNPAIVYRLDLSHQGLTQIPKSINKLKYLKRLDLSYNNLSDVSIVLDSLKNLRHLHLNNNQIKELPSTLFQFTKLKRLYLANNQLKKLSKDVIKLKKLKCLDLTNNQISKLPEELWELEDINILRFDDPIFLEFVSPFLPNQHPIFNWVSIDSPPDSIGGKPLSFYLNHSQIDPYSKLYVQGKYALDQDKAVCVFIDSIFTKNPETAKFYAYLYAVTVIHCRGDFPLFELLYKKRRAFLLEQPCLFMAYYQDYLKDAYVMDEGILDEKKYQSILTQLKNNCSFYFDNEVDLYFNYLNFFLPQVDRKGQISVRVNDTLEAIEYICLYDSKGKKMGNSYENAYYGGKKWFENILPGKYTLVFYSEEGYQKRNDKDATFLVDSVHVIMRKEVLLKSIQESVVVEIGIAPVVVPRDTLLPLPPPPPPPPSPPVQVSSVSEEFEVVEVIDEETGEVIEVYIDEERPIDSNYIKSEQARRDTCEHLFYTTSVEKLQLFLDAVYNPATKKSAISKETMNFLTAIKQYLEGEKGRDDELNPFDFPIIPSYILQNKEASIILDTEKNWSGKPVELPPRHEKMIRKKVELYYSNSSVRKSYTINRCNKYDNGCGIWMNYPLYEVSDRLLPAFCSQSKIELKYGQDRIVDQLLEEKNNCDNIWKRCATDENQASFATLKEVPNVYFTSSKDPLFPARGVYLKINDRKLVQLWYHEVEYEFCGCDH